MYIVSLYEVILPLLFNSSVSPPGFILVINPFITDLVPSYFTGCTILKLYITSLSIYDISLIPSFPSTILLLLSGNGLEASNIVVFPDPLGPIISTILEIHLLKSIQISSNPLALFIPA